MRYTIKPSWFLSYPSGIGGMSTAVEVLATTAQCDFDLEKNDIGVGNAYSWNNTIDISTQ